MTQSAATDRQMDASFHACPFPVCVVIGNRIVYLNPAYIKLTGDTTEALRRRAGNDVMALVNRDGLEVAVEAASWPIQTDSGIGQAVQFTPIDLPKPAEESTELERLYREAPVGLAFLDENLRYRRINERMARLNGQPVEAHLGRTVAEVLPNLAPHLEPLLRRILDSGEPLVDLELSGPDWEHGGKERHTLVNFRPFQDGTHRGVQACVVEVTELREAEQRLLAQAKIFEQVHEAIIQTDLDGHIWDWNGGAERLFGYTFDEAAGAHVSMLYFEEDRKDIARLALEPLLAKGRHEVVLRNRRKDSSECWIRLSLSLLRDKDGSPRSMIGYSEDITAQRQSECELKASEARYRQLFETSPVGIAVWRPDGSVVEANEVFLGMMGWTGRSANGIYGRLGPAAFRFSEPGIVETEWIRDDGSRFPVLISLARQDNAAGETLAYVVDLSSLKAAERAARESREYFEIAVRGADLAVWDWNIVTGDVAHSERWAQMLGYELNELEPRISAWEERVHPEDRQRVQEALQAHLKGRTPSYESEYRLRCKSGEWRWVWACGKVIERSPEGAPLRAAGTHLDISARKAAEMALARSEQRFHAIFDQTFQFIGLLTPSGTLLEANQTALDFGALRREDVVDRPFWDAYWWTISSESQDKLKASIAKAAKGEFIRYEAEVWGAGQTVITIDFSLRPMLDEAGHVDLIIAEGRDITEIKRAQQFVHAEGERRRLEAVFRSMTKGVVIADPQGNILSMNPAAVRLFSLPSQDDAKRHVSAFTEFEFRGLDGALVPFAEWPLPRALRGETYTGYELEVRQADSGIRFTGSFGGAPVLDDSGQTVLVVATVRDVTHEHEIERALRQSNRERDVALQAGQMRIWRWEFTSEESHAEGLPAAILGKAFHSADLPEQDVLESVHPDDRQRLGEFGQQIDARVSSEIEYRVSNSGGDYNWQASRGQAITSEQGGVLGVAGVTWDITEHKKAQAEIERMNASLHQLSGELLRLQDDERRRLARELHDGPVQVLSAAAMHLSVLARSGNLAGLASERRLAQECLDWVRQCSEEMRSLSYMLHPPILDELGLTSAMRGWIAGFADRTGLDVDLELREVGRLSADSETALFRIMQEALGNVHRHSRSSTVCVRLERAASSIKLEVEDSGCGIPAGVLEGSSTGHVLGVGIQGMRERARQLGGSIEFQSNKSGTLMRVLLPDRKAA